MNVVEASEVLTDDLTVGRGTGAMLRVLRQLIMDVDRADDRSTLIDPEPPLTGDPRWDALLAGVVDDLAFRHELPTPTWTQHPDRFLTEWWFVTRYPGLRRLAFAETPPAVGNHGVFLRRASLINV